MKRVTVIAFPALLALGLAACDGPNPGTGNKADQAGGGVAQAGRSVSQVKPGIAEQPVRPGTPDADNLLSEKVRLALLGSPGLLPQDLTIAAADGVVTLYGKVEEKSDKERVVLLAMSVDGVKSVVSNLVVERGT